MRAACSPEEVFDFLAEGTNNSLWRDSVLVIEHVSGEGVGAIWRQMVKGAGGRRVVADYEITEYVRPTRLAFQAISGPARPRGVYELKPIDGGTRLRFTPVVGAEGGRQVALAGGADDDGPRGRAGQAVEDCARGEVVVPASPICRITARAGW